MRAVDRHRRRKRIEHALRGHDCTVLVAQAFENDRELVAAEAGQGIALARALLETRGHLFEHAVAAVVSVVGVDSLEMVQV